MAYTLTTTYYDGPAVDDEFEALDDALDAWADTADAYAYGPTECVGDIRGLVLRGPAGAVIRKHGYA